MLKVIICVGIIASGKSTWAKAEVSKAPTKTVRVNKDDLRNMMNNYTFSDENEKIILSIRNYIISQSLKKGMDVIVDDTNINRRNFEDICKIVKQLNIDCMVMEKSFYVDLQEAIDRNSKRVGTAKIPEDVIKKMWKQSGQKQHQFYKPRVEVFTTTSNCFRDREFVPLEQNINLQKAIISDLDGTLAIVGARSPYDASHCDELDSVNQPVLDTINLFYNSNHKIIFCSGREQKDEPQTRRFIEKYFKGNYDLFMRQTGDKRPDDIVKEEIFNNNIKDKYFILFLLDDRNKVVDKYRSMGLTVFQVAPGNF